MLCYVMLCYAMLCYVIEDAYGDAPPPPQSRAGKSMTRGGVIALNGEKDGKRIRNDTEKCKKSKPSGILEPFWEEIRPELD
jgi:hypothetical protein